MKKSYLVIIIIIVIFTVGVFLNSDSKEEIKKDEKVKKTIKKDKFKYSTKKYDNINELLKETVIEEIKVVDVYEVPNEKNGFIEEDGNTYYYEKNRKKTGKVKIENDNYYFDENGVMQKDIEVDNAYYGVDGKMVLGEYDKHYYTSAGKLKDDFINNKYYDKNGEYVDGIKKEDDKVYYYSDSEKYKGVIKLNNVRYYFDFETGELKNKNIKHVIDISTWQEEINFDEVVNSDSVDAIIVRIGFGSLTGEPATLDNRFERNISEIKRLGIPYGIYFYGYAQNEEAAEVEANFVDEMIKKYELNLSFPIWYDAEINIHQGVKYTKSMYKKVINKFIDTLNEKGHKDVGIYGNLYMLTKGSLSFLSNKIPKWVAQYNTVCQYDKDYLGWQYTSSGNIPGINTKVDLNIFVEK